MLPLTVRMVTFVGTFSTHGVHTSRALQQMTQYQSNSYDLKGT